MKDLKYHFKTSISILKEACSVKESTPKDLVAAGGPPRLCMFSLACDNAAVPLWACFPIVLMESPSSTPRPLDGEPARCPFSVRCKVKFYRTERAELVLAALTCLLDLGYMSKSLLSGLPIIIKWQWLLFSSNK